MSQRKRRSNRMTAEELETNQDERERRMNQLVVMFRCGQDDLAWTDRCYRSVSLRVALRSVVDGDAEKIVVDTENGRVLMFNELKQVKGAIYRSPTTLTMSTMNAVANDAPKAQLSRSEKAHIDKVIMWPFIGDTKATCVRPRVGDRERKQAESLMRHEQGSQQRRPNVRVWMPQLQAAA